MHCRISKSNDSFPPIVLTKMNYSSVLICSLPSIDLWDLYVNVPGHRLDLWSDIMPNFVYNSELPFFDILVPTIDTVRFSYIMTKLVERNRPVFFTGGTG